MEKGSDNDPKVPVKETGTTENKTEEAAGAVEKE